MSRALASLDSATCLPTARWSVAVVGLGDEAFECRAHDTGTFEPDEMAGTIDDLELGARQAVHGVLRRGYGHRTGGSMHEAHRNRRFREPRFQCLHVVEHGGLDRVVRRSILRQRERECPVRAREVRRPYQPVRLVRLRRRESTGGFSLSEFAHPGAPFDTEARPLRLPELGHPPVADRSEWIDDQGTEEALRNSTRQLQRVVPAERVAEDIGAIPPECVHHGLGVRSLGLHVKGTERRGGFDAALLIRRDGEPRREFRGQAVEVGVADGAAVEQEDAWSLTRAPPMELAAANPRRDQSSIHSPNVALLVLGSCL